MQVDREAVSIEEAKRRADLLEQMSEEADEELTQLREDIPKAKEAYDDVMGQRADLLKARSESIDKREALVREVKHALEEFKARETIAGDWRIAIKNLNKSPDLKADWPGIHGKLDNALRAAFRDVGLGILSAGPEPFDLTEAIDVITSGIELTCRDMVKDAEVDETTAKAAYDELSDEHLKAKVDCEVAEEAYRGACQEVEPLRHEVNRLNGEVGRLEDKARLSAQDARRYRTGVERVELVEKERQEKKDREDAKARAEEDRKEAAAKREPAPGEIPDRAPPEDE